MLFSGVNFKQFPVKCIKNTKNTARKNKENVLSVPRNMFKKFVKFNLTENGIN